MKKIKLLILILTLFSFHAGATGYTHNMFVAHKKLQAGKESAFEKMTAKKVKPLVKFSKPVAHVKETSVLVDTKQLSDAITLNERVLKAGPASFFENDQESESDESMVTKLVAAVRCVIYTFIGRLC
jgi:hypothetical protein